jgi:SNF2 family DNA or RNA helicase
MIQTPETTSTVKSSKAKSKRHIIINTDQPINKTEQSANRLLSIEQFYDHGYSQLTTEQVLIVKECLERDAYGLSLHMGSGKTIISIITALNKKIESGNKEPILVVVSKSLISSWEIEIKKFFKDFPYQIMNINSRRFVLNPETILVLVTPETLAIFYSDNNIQENFVTKEIYTGHRGLPIIKNIYNIPIRPYLKHATGGSILYSKTWAYLIIDECHKYTNITSNRCQSIGAIYSDYRAALSGTLFDEPAYERVLGYYVILQWPNFPKNLPDAITFINSGNFKGVRETIIEREKVELDIKVNKHVIKHDLTNEEGMVYVSMKRTLAMLRRQLRLATNDPEARKKFSTYILAMITYLRQSIVSPILPIANITLNMSELGENKSELSMMLMDEFSGLGITEYLSNTESMRSSRINEIIRVIEKHNRPKDKMVLFSCFCTSIDIIEYYVSQMDIDHFKLESSQSIATRGKLINDFQKSKNSSILLATYDLGSEGLNLQAANVVIIVDFWWNVAKTSQAIARVLRRGQMANEIDVYFFTSNTGIEKSLFQKQQDKLLLLEELKDGNVKSRVHTIKIQEILNLIDSNENYDSLLKLY